MTSDYKRPPLSAALRTVLHPATIGIYVLCASVLGLLVIRDDQSRKVVPPIAVPSLETEKALAAIKGQNSELLEQNRILLERVDGLSDRLRAVEAKLPERKESAKGRTKK